MQEVIENTKTKKDIVLPSKVTIKASRKNTWLPENHDGSFRFTNAAEELTVQVNRETGQLITGLDTDTQARLEKALNLLPGALSPNKGTYWPKFKIRVPQAGVVLSPKSNASDELAYRIALVHTEIANSLTENKNGLWPFSRYVMHSEEEETATINKSVNLKLDAFKALGSMTETEKRNFLTVYGKAVGKDATIDFVTAQVGKIVDSEPEMFLTTINNPNYKVQLFIKQCLASGVLKESAGKFMRPGGEPIAYSITQLEDFLMNPENQEVKISLINQMKALA